MKKLVLFSIVPALGLGMFTMNASALPKNLESVNVHCTLNFQSGEGKVTKVSLNNKDVLNDFIAPEYDITMPNSAQLVDYGVGDDQDLAVWDNHAKDYVLENASSDEDDYELYITANEEDEYVTQEHGNSDTYTYTFAYSEFYYHSDSEEVSLNLEGLGKVTDNFHNDNESFNITGSGYFDLGIGEGVVTGSVSGSGQDVYTF